jgi:hypothetical protein
MKHIIILVLGDWGHGGHGKSSIVTIRSNLTKSEIEEAYRKGIQKVGVSFIEEIGAKYEDYTGCEFNEEDFGKLEDAGIDTSDIDEDVYAPGGYRIFEKGFVNIYLSLVKLGNPEFKWDQVSADENHIRIGGYGLF